MVADRLLTPTEFAFLARSRTAVLATIDDAGAPRLVPICFVASASPALVIYTPIDDKPKQVAEPHDLRRVRDVLRRQSVALLIDRWSEDWTRLGWLRLNGRAGLMEPADASAGVEHATAVAALREKYPQYATHRLEARPMIRIRIDRIRSWGSLDGSDEGPG